MRVAPIPDADIGFGFGALAAGAELLTAEALLARGAELHVILPSDPESFAAALRRSVRRSLAPRASTRVLAAAESVRAVRPLRTRARPRQHRPRRPDRARRGAAQRRAADGGGGGAAGRRRRDDGGLALLAIRVGAAAGAGFEDRLGEVRDALWPARAARALSPHLGGETIVIGYADCAGAAAAARAVHARLREQVPLQVAGHYGLIDRVRDPFSGTLRPTGSGADIVEAIAGATPPGSICVSDDFAAVLAAAAGRRARPAGSASSRPSTAARRSGSTRFGP